MTEPRNLAAIKNWVAANRPDCAQHFDRMITDPNSDAFVLIMTICFEAGRSFQANEAADPARYVAMEETY